MHRRHFVTTALAAAFWPHAARAEWPADRPVQVFVPGPPGGGMDVLARAFLPHVQRRLPGALFVIQNRAAAAGQQAFEGIALAPPDGFTIGAAQAPNSITLPIERETRYKVQDFAFLGNVIDDPCGMWVHKESPIRNLADLIAAAKQRPASVSVGSAGLGTDDHLLMLALQDAAGVEFLHIPHNGTPPIVTGLMSRTLEVGSFNMSEGRAMAREGTLRSIGQAGPQRWPAMDQVPTFREQNIDIVAGSTRGLVAPANLPVVLRDALRTAVAAANADPEWIADAERLNLPRRPMSAQDQQDLFFAEDAKLRARWARKPWRE